MGRRWRGRATAVVAAAIAIGVAVPAHGVLPLVAGLGKQLIKNMLIDGVKSQLMGSLAEMGCKGSALASVLASTGGGRVALPGGIPGLPAGLSPMRGSAMPAAMPALPGAVPAIAGAMPSPGDAMSMRAARAAGAMPAMPAMPLPVSTRARSTRRR